MPLWRPIPGIVDCDDADVAISTTVVPAKRAFFIIAPSPHNSDRMIGRWTDRQLCIGQHSEQTLQGDAFLPYVSTVDHLLVSEHVGNATRSYIGHTIREILESTLAPVPFPLPGAVPRYWLRGPFSSHYAFLMLRSIAVITNRRTIFTYLPT